MLKSAISKRRAIATSALILSGIGFALAALLVGEPTTGRGAITKAATAAAGATATPATPIATAAESAPPVAAALVATTMQSKVGVLLDEIPQSMRARVVQALIARPEGFWKARAMQQLRLTTYRLVFRTFFYSASRQQLPLPPEALWNITLLGQPTRQTIDGHDLVVVDYRFNGTLLTDTESPETSEPMLRQIGGTWDEQFLFPIDPEMVFQRTGFACMDEEDFPFNSVDSEEVDSFYDEQCTVEKELAAHGQCHFARMPTKSCAQALTDHVGKVATHVRYERLPWNAAVADQVRYGLSTGDEPDLQVYLPDFVPSRITYRYIHANSCEMAERCVSGTGWRRLLQFATSDENVGNSTLTIGGVDYTLSGHAGELDTHNLFEFSACHAHYHFKYYGSFDWEGKASDTIDNHKQAFCLQSTARTANRETSPLHNAFAGCDFQGVEAGWVDQYKAGLPCQWLDITDSATGTGARAFTSNPQGLLCEGRFLDANGQPLAPGAPVVWEPTGLIAENGEPVEAPKCALKTGWDANNAHVVNDTVPPPGEGMITTDCTRGQLGPLRNCGFRKQTTRATCTPGQTVRLSCSIGSNAKPQVVRFCDYSQALGSAIPCRAEDTWVPLAPGVTDQPSTLATAVVGATPTAVTFTCPSERTQGTYEPGGAYSVYAGAVFPDDAVAKVTCQ